MIIGLCGYAGSGKDTVAQILVQEHGFERRAFADKLKAIAYDIDIDLAEAVDLLGWDRAKQIPKYRALLQDLGVAVREHLGEDAWVNAVLPPEPIAKPGSLWDYVITDVRFNNEIDRILDLGGKVGEVIRPGIAAINNHVSETEWGHRREEFHFQIFNNRTIPILRTKVIELANIGFEPKSFFYKALDPSTHTQP